MDIVYTIWGFFIETHEWFLGLWDGWWNFFKSIPDWYIDLPVGCKILVGLMYIIIGIQLTRIGNQIETSWQNHEKAPFFKKWLYRVIKVLILPISVTYIVAASVPVGIGFFFYAAWFGVWSAIAVIGLIVLLFAWPLSLLL